MNVLIVSRTKMSGNDRCIGALTQENKSIRLLTKAGGHQSVASHYEIGQIWDLEWIKPECVEPPHVEDVLVNSHTFVGTQGNLAAHLRKRIAPIEGPIDKLFDSFVRYTNKSNGYISKPGVPRNSVGFWVSDRSLRLREDGKHYDYINGYAKRGMAYVGEVQPFKEIPAGTLVRVSLARWWRPQDTPDLEKRCYLQLSGWYANP